MRARALWLSVLCSACATLADGEPGLDNVPTAKAGPFRLFADGELAEPRSAPYAMDDATSRLRDLSVVDLDGDPGTLAVDGYFSANAEADPEGAPPTSIVRVGAPDGRSFGAQPEVVLSSTRRWEGGTVGAPSVLPQSGGAVLLYYAGAGGVGLASSPDGVSFTPADEPVLDVASCGWCGAPPSSPAVVQLGEGALALFFETTRGGRAAIGQATSADGVVWTVDPAGPVLTTGAPGGLDDVWIGTPYAVRGTSTEGREILYVYYAARAESGKQVIGVAARFLDDPDAPLEKSASNVFTPSSRVEPREPAVVRFSEFTFFFVTQYRSTTVKEPVVPGGVSPANVDLTE